MDCKLVQETRRSVLRLGVAPINYQKQQYNLQHSLISKVLSCHGYFPAIIHGRTKQYENGKRFWSIGQRCTALRNRWVARSRALVLASLHPFGVRKSVLNLSKRMAALACISVGHRKSF
ncbi:hypothetical protein KIN20_038399 [Parelaphostrongylus tenuis]|uniref:Uncharacterized protein n=1 Tax=Parelaphostrongylus tenuis TaxID=148309 RepID=A0AAD5MUV6_PARTN|nr:hypothetical protein KIN20_038399 [Parelaphostrongylus tenuis]